MSVKRKNVTKSKQNYKRFKGGGGGGKLEIGMRGILISHDRNREKSCRIDSYKILNYFADKIYGPEFTKEGSNSDSEEDIEKALGNEVSLIKKTTSEDSTRKRRFVTVKSGCNNLIFIKCQGFLPSDLVKSVVEGVSSITEFKSSEIPHTKDVLRMHPVDFTCPAYVPDMVKSIPPFLEKELEKLSKEEPNCKKEYAIEYKCRNNSHLSRETVFNGLYEEMKDSPSKWRYNCRTDHVSVIIDVLKTICLVSVIQGYRTKKRYNIRELFMEKCNKKTITESEQVVKTEIQSEHEESDSKQVSSTAQV